MNKLKAWWAKSRWAVWVVIGVIFAIMVLVLRSLGGGKKQQPIGMFSLPPIPKVIQEKVHKAEEDGLRARVEASVKAESEKKQLAEVMAVDDGAERRKRLAEMLSKT